MPRVKVTIAIPDDVLETADKRAEAERCNRSKLFTAAIKSYLSGESHTEYDDGMTMLREQITTLESALKSVKEDNQNLAAKVKAEGVNCQRALAEQESRHKDTLNEEEHRHKDITNALRHEQELTQTKLEATQRELQLERDHSREIRDTMEQLQKQLELVTLRLPAPKAGFWSRILNRGKAKEAEN